MDRFRALRWVLTIVVLVGVVVLFVGCGRKEAPKPGDQVAPAAKPSCCVAADKRGFACPKCTVSAKPKEPPAETAHNEGDLDTAALKALMASDTPPVIFDARGERMATVIPGAIGMGTRPTAERVAEYAKSKDTALVSYCSNLQCPASRMLGRHLRDLGYVNVKEYPYGIEGWQAAGNEVEKGKK